MLELSDKIISRDKLTALMITHNMKDAIRHGNRLIMMNEGEIILDVKGEEKQHLTKHDLMDKFAELAGTTLDSDEILLSKWKNPRAAEPVSAERVFVLVWG